MNRYACYLLAILLQISFSVLKAEGNERDSLLTVWENNSAADTARMSAMYTLIRKYYFSKKPDSAQYYAKQMYAFAKEKDNSYYQAQSHYIQGNSILLIGQIEEGKKQFEAALAIWKDLENQPRMADTYNALGLAHKNMGSYDTARSFFEKNISISHELGDSSGSVSPTINMAAIYEAEGDILKSLEWNQRGVSLAQRYNKKRAEAIGHNNLANNYKYLGDIPNASRHYLLSRAIYEDTGNYWGVVSSLNNLALLYIDDKTYEKAKGYLDESQEIAEENQLFQGQAMTFVNLGYWHQEQKQFNEALPFFQNGLKVIEEQGIVYMQPYAELEMGSILLSLQRYNEAKTYLDKGLANAEKLGIIGDILNGHLYMSRLMTQKREWNQARSYAQKGFDLAKQSNQPGEMAEFAHELVKINKHFGNITEAFRMYETEVKLRDSIFNEENTRALINQEYQYTYQKKSYQDSLINASKLELQAADLERRKLTNWFLVGILLLVGLFGVLLYNRYRFIQQQEKRIKEEKEKAEAANAKLRELDGFKSRFFTNISHEFRTPLTVIGGMVDQISSDPDKWINKGSTLIRRNVNGLLNLINQILDLRKLESGNLSLSLIQHDIVRFLKYGTESFESLARSQEIILTFIPQIEEQMMDFDPDKLLQIQTNLISNAIKFTPKGGKIEIKVEKETGNKLAIIVEDTGKGIPPEKLSMIFDRFYQVDNTDTREGEGTGIGLSLTKELVNLMNGDISVESELGKGTRFTVQLPISQMALISSPAAIEPKLVDPEVANTPIASKKSLGENPRLLIIEDNPDIVEYLYACLEDDYELLSAPDGEVGIEVAFEQVPDLIITDVMMPRKNGYEVCETLKLDERTSHIPIVMLTAKADHDSRMEGYKRGADAYLSKPFNQEELSIRLEKLWEIRQRLQARYQQGSNPPKTDDPAIKIEDAFLTKIRELVHSNIDETNYRGDAICEDLSISRTNLHRKIKALTGKTTSAFIRSIRLDFAKDLLLKDTNLTVAEVAYSTGFNDPAYFNRVFNKAFDMSPGEWREAEMG